LVVTAAKEIVPATPTTRPRMKKTALHIHGNQPAVYRAKKNKPMIA